MTPIWNEEIERIKQDPDASVFLVSFASQTEARSTIHKLSFARQITKDGKTALALPGHITFKVGKSPEGDLWILLAGRLSTDECLEAYELFGIYGGEQTIVIPSQVENQLNGVAESPVEIASVQEPAQEPAEIKFTPFVAAPVHIPIEVAPAQSPTSSTKAQDSTVMACTPALVNFTAATEPVVSNSVSEPTEINLTPFTQKSIKTASTLTPVVLASGQESTVLAPAHAPAIILQATDPVITKAPESSAAIKTTPADVQAPQTPTEMKAAPVAVNAASKIGKVESVSESAKVTPTPVITAQSSQNEVKSDSPPTASSSDNHAATRIYLAREGTRKGPFTLEHINAEIAAGHYRDDHYWAWHDGLPEWIPLYKVEGVGKRGNVVTATKAGG